MKSAADHVDEEKKPSEGKLCGQMKQKRSCSATMRSNMFGGQKMSPLSPRKPHLLSSKVLVVL